MVRFSDPWNPSHDEVVAWAFDEDALEPTQDFDLALSWHRGLERTYLELASDDSCPKRVYFLSVLYLMVGDAVRAGFRNVAQPLVEALVDAGNDHRHEDIQLWQVRARDLLAHPEGFEYDAWCGGGLARNSGSVERPDEPE